MIVPNILNSNAVTSNVTTNAATTERAFVHHRARLAELTLTLGHEMQMAKAYGLPSATIDKFAAAIPAVEQLDAAVAVAQRRYLQQQRQSQGS